MHQSSSTNLLSLQLEPTLFEVLAASLSKKKKLFLLLLPSSSPPSISRQFQFLEKLFATRKEEGQARRQRNAARVSPTTVLQALHCFFFFFDDAIFFEDMSALFINNSIQEEHHTTIRCGSDYRRRNSDWQNCRYDIIFNVIVIFILI